MKHPLQKSVDTSIVCHRKKKKSRWPEQKAWQQRCSRTAINKFRRAYYVRRNVFHSSSERAANEIANVLRKWYGSTHSQRNGLALQPNKRTFGSHDDGAQMNMCRSTELGPYLSDILQHTWNHDVKVQLFLFRNFPVLLSFDAPTNLPIPAHHSICHSVVFCARHVRDTRFALRVNSTF